MIMEYYRSERVSRSSVGTISPRRARCVGAVDFFLVNSSSCRHFHVLSDGQRRRKHREVDAVRRSPPCCLFDLQKSIAISEVGLARGKRGVHDVVVCLRCTRGRATIFASGTTVIIMRTDQR